jgi:YggT family protein
MRYGIRFTRVIQMIIKIIDVFFQVYMIMLLIRIFSSWIPELQRTRFLMFIAFYTDPYLNFFRRFIPPLGVIDISPIFAFLCLGIIEAGVKFLVGSLLR